MSKPITKIASEATHGNSSVESPTKYVNKMEAKSSQMIHKSWPKLEEGFKEGVKNAKEEAMLNTKPITEEDVCGEGFQKNEAGECVTIPDNDLTVETNGGTGGDGTLDAADQSGGDAN